jgi:CheY-like chemotaxis protein
MKGDEQLCLEAGMDAYVTKPVRPEQLLDVIEEFAAVRLVTPVPASN